MENLTHPGKAPVEGDTVKIDRGSGRSSIQQFHEPVPTPTPEPITVISRYELRSRFTQAEKVAIYTAAETNIAIKVWLDDLQSATSVDLTLPATIAGVEALESAKLIETGRAKTILVCE